MPKYTVVHPVEHDQKRYEVDSTLTVSEEVAAPLLVVGAVVEYTGKTRADKAAEKAAAEREAAEKAEAERRAAELHAKRDELQQHIAALETAIGEAESDEAKALIQQQLDEAKAELQALE